MDISQAWPFLKISAFATAGWTIFHFASYLRRRFIRVFAKIIGAGVLASGVFAGLVLLLLNSVFSKHAGPIYSPDRRYVAVVTYGLQGALGDDYANVGLRPWWRPYLDIVYAGLGTWDFKKNAPGDPEVHWQDTTHLVIRYRDDRAGNEGRGGPGICQSRMDDVEIA